MGSTDSNGIFTPDLDEEGWDPELATNFDLFSQNITDHDAHIADTSAAHAASAVSFTPTGTVAATDVQAAIAEVASEAAAAGAPGTADYLVGTTQAGLSAEIVVGASPGGELGGTWASPTVDGTHAGSTHSAAADTHIADTSAAHTAASIAFTAMGGIVATDVQAALQEVDSEAAKLAGANTFTQVNAFPAGGITIGSDVNLYRSAADTLKTDDGLTVTGEMLVSRDGGAPAIAVNALSVVANGVAHDASFELRNTGSGGLAVIRWSDDAGAVIGALSNYPVSGSLSFYSYDASAMMLELTSAGVLWIGSTKDTNLYRSAADTLKTDDSLVVVGPITQNAGKTVLDTDHTGAADPHTGYQKESEKAAASGYASLDGSTKVPVAQLPTGTSSSTVALGDAAAALDATHAGAADPHTGYRLESADHSHASTGLQGGQIAGSDLSGTPSGELGGTWGSVTVDSSHAGGTHAATQAAAEATAAAANTADIATHAGLADPHTGYQRESEKAAASGYASLDGSTKVPLAQIPTGTSSSTVALGDAAAALDATHAAAADPHTGYLKESDVAAKGDLFVASANDTVGILTAPTTRGQRLGADEAGNVGWAPIASGPAGVRLWDDFFYGTAPVPVAASGTNVGFCQVRLSGTLAVMTVNGMAAVPNHPGVVQLGTGTTTTGAAELIAGNTTISLGGGRARYGAWIYLPALSVVAQRFEVMCGFTDNVSAATTVDGAFLHYIDTVNSGKWEAITSANSVTTATVTDTGITVNAAQWFFLEVECNAAGTSVTYYIDKTLVATHAANIPTGAGRETAFQTGLIKSLGTTSALLNVDAHYLELDFTTAR